MTNDIKMLKLYCFIKTHIYIEMIKLSEFLKTVFLYKLLGIQKTQMFIPFAVFLPLSIIIFLFHIAGMVALTNLDTFMELRST